MVMLSKKDILEVNDKKTKVINVPEWGGDITLSVLASQDRDRYEEILTSDTIDKYDNVVANYVAKSIVDDKGERLFSEKDIAALGKKSGVVMLRIFKEAGSLNDFSDKEITDLAKN